MPSDEARDGHGENGDKHKVIKCSTLKRRKRKTKPYGDCRCFTPGGSHQRVKLVCVFPFPDGDARKTQRFIPVRAREGPASSGREMFLLSCT